MQTTGKPQSLALSDELDQASLSSFMRAWLDHHLALTRADGKGLAVFVVRIDEYWDLKIRSDESDLRDAMAELKGRLNAILRLADLAASPLEDGFVVIRAFSGNPLSLPGMARAILKRLQQPLRLGGVDRCLAVSIGIAFHPEDGHCAASLLDNAYDALERTNRWGGNGFCFYSRAAARQIQDDLEKQRDLRRALVGGHLSMAFQPILALARDDITAAAAHVYWLHPTRGQLEGDDISLIAERSGLVPGYNQWMAGRLLRQLQSWRGGRRDRTISIDISRSQLLDDGAATIIAAGLPESGVHADRIEIGIDHRVFSNELDHRVRTALEQLADLGISLRLANIGEGPLILQNLQRLPVQAISLAPEMIFAIGRCLTSERILQSIIGFAHDLGLCVRAVGVNSKAQLDVLKSKNCDEACGPFFAPALNGHELDQLNSLVLGVKKQTTVSTVTGTAAIH